MNRFKIFIVIGFLVFAGAAAAEFYKYTDENGNIRFTDDINQIPPDQREKAKGYQEFQSETEEASQSSVDGDTTSEKDETVQGSEAGKSENFDFDNELKTLDKRKAELASEYDSLMQENARLAEDKKTVKNKADAEKYNERVRVLNEKLKDHDRKRREFFGDVEDYNARVAKENQSRKKAKSNPQ